MTREQIESILKPGITIGQLRGRVLNEEQIRDLVQRLTSASEMEENNEWTPEIWTNLNRPMSI